MESVVHHPDDETNLGLIENLRTYSTGLSNIFEQLYRRDIEIFSQRPPDDEETNDARAIIAGNLHYLLHCYNEFYNLRPGAHMNTALDLLNNGKKYTYLSIVYPYDRERQEVGLDDIVINEDEEKVYMSEPMDVVEEEHGGRKLKRQRTKRKRTKRKRTKRKRTKRRRTKKGF